MGTLTNDQCGVCERAFSLLALYGVPRKRARTVDNGIEVLATRVRKQHADDTSLIDRLTQLATHLRHCRWCGETDVKECEEGTTLWRAAMGGDP